MRVKEIVMSPTAGEHIDRCIEQAIEMSSKYDCTCLFTHNDKTIVIHRNDNFDVVKRKWVGEIR